MEIVLFGVPPQLAVRSVYPEKCTVPCFELLTRMVESAWAVIATSSVDSKFFTTSIVARVTVSKSALVIKESENDTLASDCAYTACLPYIGSPSI